MKNFDQWYSDKYGADFDTIYGGMLIPIGEYFRALSRHMREYISEAVKDAATAPEKP